MTAMTPVRAALLLAACTLLPAAAWAARPVPVFQVPVAGQTAPDLQQAMRAALVRATGRRRSAGDPVFSGLVADAPKYVQSYERGPHGELQVVFNATAVDKAIAALDRSVWDPDRPFTLVVLYPPLDQTDQAEDQAALEEAAEQRGLPISIVPLPVADSSGNLLPSQALLEIAHQYGAEQLLVGKPPAAEVAAAAGMASPGTAAPSPGQAAGASPPAAAASAAPPATAPTVSPAAAAAAPGAAPATAPAQGQVPPQAQAQAQAQGQGDWQWTLYTNFATQSWSGSVTAGIDDTVDLLAPPAGPASANMPVAAQVKFEGVSSLADYAHIEMMLGAVPGVSAASVSQISGDSVVFDLTVRGGEAAIGRELSGSPSFTRAGPDAQDGRGAGGPLVFRYRSG